MTDKTQNIIGKFEVGPSPEGSNYGFTINFTGAQFPNKPTAELFAALLQEGYERALDAIALATLAGKAMRKNDKATAEADSKAQWQDNYDV